MNLQPITRQIAFVGLIITGLMALWLKETNITNVVIVGLFALLKGEVRH